MRSPMESVPYYARQHMTWEVIPAQQPYLAELVQPALGVLNCLDPVLRLRISVLQRVLERGEPGVECNDACRASQLLFDSLGASKRSIPVPSLGISALATCPPPLASVLDEFSAMGSIFTRGVDQEWPGNGEEASCCLIKAEMGGGMPCFLVAGPRSGKPQTRWRRA